MRSALCFTFTAIFCFILASTVPPVAAIKFFNAELIDSIKSNINDLFKGPPPPTPPPMHRGNAAGPSGVPPPNEESAESRKQSKQPSRTGSPPPLTEEEKKVLRMTNRLIEMKDSSLQLEESIIQYLLEFPDGIPTAVLDATVEAMTKLWHFILTHQPSKQFELLEDLRKRVAETTKEKAQLAGELAKNAAEAAAKSAAEVAKDASLSSKDHAERLAAAIRDRPVKTAYEIGFEKAFGKVWESAHGIVGVTREHFSDGVGNNLNGLGERFGTKLQSGKRSIESFYEAVRDSLLDPIARPHSEDLSSGENAIDEEEDSSERFKNVDNAESRYDARGETDASGEEAPFSTGLIDEGKRAINETPEEENEILLDAKRDSEHDTIEDGGYEDQNEDPIEAERLSPVPSKAPDYHDTETQNEPPFTDEDQELNDLLAPEVMPHDTTGHYPDVENQNERYYVVETLEQVVSSALKHMRQDTTDTDTDKNSEATINKESDLESEKETDDVSSEYETEEFNKESNIESEKQKDDIFSESKTKEFTEESNLESKKEKDDISSESEMEEFSGSGYSEDHHRSTSWPDKNLNIKEQDIEYKGTPILSLQLLRASALFFSASFSCTKKVVPKFLSLWFKNVVSAKILGWVFPLALLALFLLLLESYVLRPETMADILSDPIRRDPDFKLHDEDTIVRQLVDSATGKDHSTIQHLSNPSEVARNATKTKTSREQSKLPKSSSRRSSSRTKNSSLRRSSRRSSLVTNDDENHCNRAENTSERSQNPHRGERRQTSDKKKNTVGTPSRSRNSTSRSLH